MDLTWPDKVQNLSGILHFLAQLAWFVYLIWLIIYSVFFLLEATDITSVQFFYLQAQFELHNIEDLLNFGTQNLVSIHDSTLSIRINNLDAGSISGWYYFGAFLMQIGLNAGILYGLTLLKRILKSLWLKTRDSWSYDNIQYLRNIGYLMLAAVPCQYAIGWLSYLTVKQLQLSNKLTLFWPSLHWEIGLAGLAVLLVAHIFKEGARMHQEQKLTV